MEGRRANVATDREYSDEEPYDDAACFLVGESFVPSTGEDKRTTMNKKQRKDVKEGVEAVNEQDTAMWSTLSGRPLFAKVLFVIAMAASQFQPSVGQQTQFVAPGHEAKACDEKMIHGPPTTD